MTNTSQNGTEVKKEEEKKKKRKRPDNFHTLRPQETQQLSGRSYHPLLDQYRFLCLYYQQSL